MTYEDSCRTCLGKTKDMRHIHSAVLIGGVDVRLSDILLNFYNYQLPDKLDEPQNLCINCVHQLTMTKAFKTLIDASTKTLSDNITLEDFCDDTNLDEDYKPDIKYSSDSEKEMKRYEPKAVRKVQKVKKIKAPPRKFSKILMRRRPAETENQYFCVDCKERFPNKKELFEHCSNNHPAKSTKGRDCSYCHEKFEDYKDLVIHTKLHQKPYLCLTCWYGYYTENDYITHECSPALRKRGESEKVMCQCDQCGKSYPAGYIKIHMATHGTEMKYSCKYCPKKFKVANGLNSHVLWNHKRTRDHKCEVCGATFISASARSTHYRKNHLKEKKYCCENCTKRFFSKSELQRHMLTHTGVKNFHCHICEKSYQTRYGLNVHLKSHAQMNVNVIM